MSALPYRPAMMLGRLSNGAESDHGTLVHAVRTRKCKRPPCPFNDYGRKAIPNDDYTAEVSLCGRRPGRRSVGWSWNDKDMAVSCPKCLSKLEKE